MLLVCDQDKTFDMLIYFKKNLKVSHILAFKLIFFKVYNCFTAPVEALLVVFQQEKKILQHYMPPTSPDCYNLSTQINKAFTT